MVDTGRLGELQRKFDENPRRYFAPLANEYRKTGNTARAIELCRTYLPHLPGHMSGYIVYGQSLFDAGYGMEATAVFQEALRIDPENVIALRHLGDIARLAGNRDDAMQWYRQVIEIDPKNEEIAGYITGLAVGENFSEPSAAPLSNVAEAHAVKAHVAQAPASVLEAEAPSEAHEAPDASEQNEYLSEPWNYTDFSLDTSLTPSESTDNSVLSFAAEPEDAYLAEESQVPSVDEFDHTFAAQETASFFNQSAQAAEAHEITEQSVPSEPLEPIETPEVVSPVVAPSPSAPSVSTPFVTETMAELYLLQGLTTEALSVYRQLAATRNDPALNAKIENLEAQIEAKRAYDKPKVTVREFFARIGNARPTTEASPTRPDVAPAVADDNSTLSHLFDSSQVDLDDARAARVLASAYARNA